MDVGAWLRGLGLGQYEGAFRDSEIEADILPELTETDLETIHLPFWTPKANPKGDSESGRCGQDVGSRRY